MAKMRVIDIDENTRVPLRIFNVLVVIAVGGAGWATKVAFTIEQAQADIIAVQVKQDKYTDNHEAINTRLSYIEGTLRVRAPASEK